jgi:hypothetical protein
MSHVGDAAKSCPKSGKETEMCGGAGKHESLIAGGTGPGPESGKKPVSGQGVYPHHRF